MKRSTVAAIALTLLVAAVSSAAIVTSTADEYLAGRELSVELNGTATGETVRLDHEGGDALNATNTGALWLVVTDESGDRTVVTSRRVESGDETFPFTDGSTARIHAPAAEPGMRLEVVWVGPSAEAGERTLLDTEL